jgi:hypothetical protein
VRFLKEALDQPFKSLINGCEAFIYINGVYFEHDIYFLFRLNKFWIKEEKFVNYYYLCNIDR